MRNVTHTDTLRYNYFLKVLETQASYTNIDKMIAYLDKL